MSACNRCGSNACKVLVASVIVGRDVTVADVVDCRDREISNLHSLLRSVTRRLEHAEYLLSEVPMPTAGTERARAEIDAVLEALS